MSLSIRRLIPLALSLVLTCAHADVRAGEILIDFETLPGADGVLGTADDVPTDDVFLQPLGDKFASAGVVFTQGTLLQSDFFDGNPVNHYISSTSPVGFFTRPVTGISIDSRSFWDAVLTAYDSQGNVMASDTLLNPNAGREILQGVLSISTTAPIYGFSILPNNPNYILNLDNLRLTIAEVPEPGQLPLLATGLALMATLRRRRV